MAKAESENVRDILVGRAAVDGTAFALLYDIYYERILSYCVSRLRQRQIAQDFTSATFLAAVQKIPKFRGKTRIEFANWLYSIATAKINSYLSKKQTIERLMATEAEIQQDTITWPMLHNAILKLKPRQQTVIALRFFENLNIDRIAEITGLRPDSVRFRIAGAIENIKPVDTEKQLEDVIKKIDIDDIPDSWHKEKLRAKVLDSFDSARRRKSLAFLYITSAAAVLITIGLVLRYYPTGKTPLPVKKLMKPLPTAVPVNLPPEQKERTRLETIKQYAAEENIPELLKILEGNDLTARLLVAKYLAEITDSNVADIMRLVQPAEKQADVSKPAVQKSEEQKSILVAVTDKKTKLPLSGVSLQISLNGKKELNEGVTDANGQYLLALPAEPLNQLQIRAAAEGYAAMKMQRQSAVTEEAAVSFEMSQVSQIGGLVVDEQLNPVENAEVKVQVGWDFNSQVPVVDMDEIFKTDVNGIWRSGSFPEDACRAAVKVTHPNYILQEGYRPAIVEELKNFSYVTFLEKGVAVAGRVLDWEQKPLRATVTKRTSSRQNPVICEPNGWFRFDNVAPSIEVFTVQCKGAAPQVRQVDVGPNMPPMDFSLEPANTIRAKVVDIDGTPLKDVHVRVESWMGFDTLNFETKTDTNGFFQWTDAPPDEVLFDLYKPGYVRINSFEMMSKNDYVITLLAGTDEAE